MKDVTAELKGLLKQLVSIDTTSSRANAAIIDVLERRLALSGFALTRQKYVDDAGVEKTNLVAKKGTFDVAPLALVGHTDCVPFDPAWKEALSLTERDGNLYGRGACDTKAFIACSVIAAERAAKDGLLLLFTADEETGYDGVKHLAAAGLGRARQAIVGEPTSLTPIRANKGYCLAEVEVKGKEGHSAYPDTGASAIFRAARFIKRLEEFSLGELRVQELRDPSFDPPYTTLNVGLISGGKAKNILAGSCRFTLEWRPVPKQPLDMVAVRIRNMAAELRREDPSFEFDLNVLRMDSGADTPADAEVVRFLEQESGNAAQTVAFGTEAGHMTAQGAQSVVFGPGNIRHAHQTGEFVPVVDLIRCEEILEMAIRRFV